MQVRGIDPGTSVIHGDSHHSDGWRTRLTITCEIWIVRSCAVTPDSLNFRIDLELSGIRFEFIFHLAQRL